MPLAAGLRATLAAAALVEAYAGGYLVLAPARFVRATYGARAGALDPLTLKFARCAAGAAATLRSMLARCRR
jgi:hypothetical protein